MGILCPKMLNITISPDRRTSITLASDKKGVLCFHLCSKQAQKTSCSTTKPGKQPAGEPFRKASSGEKALDENAGSLRSRPVSSTSHSNRKAKELQPSKSLQTQVSKSPVRRLPASNSLLNLISPGLNAARKASSTGLGQETKD